MSQGHSYHDLFWSRCSLSQAVLAVGAHQAAAMHLAAKAAANVAMFEAML